MRRPNAASCLLLLFLLNSAQMLGHRIIGDDPGIAASSGDHGSAVAGVQHGIQCISERGTLVDNGLEFFIRYGNRLVSVQTAKENPVSGAVFGIQDEDGTFSGIVYPLEHLVDGSTGGAGGRLGEFQLADPK